MANNILITGASTGIGRACALEFARQGAKSLTLIARRQDALNEVAEICHTFGCHTHLLIEDLSQVATLSERLTQRLKSLPKIDVLVNNVGEYCAKTFTETTLDELQRLLQINLMSHYALTQLCLNEMLACQQGDIYFIGSVASQQAFPNGSAYTITKHALAGFARSLRQELKGENIRVTSFFPGATNTPSWDGCTVNTQKMIPAQDIAKLLVCCQSLDRRTNVEEILMRAQGGDFDLV